MEFAKIIVLGIILSVLTVLLKNIKPEYSLICVIVGSIILVMYILSGVQSIFEYFKTIENVSMVMPVFDASEYVSIDRGKYTFQSPIMAVDFDLMEKIGYSLKDGTFENLDKQ